MSLCHNCGGPTRPVSHEWDMTVAGKTYRRVVDGGQRCDSCGPDCDTISASQLSLAERLTAIEILSQDTVSGEELKFARRAYGFTRDELAKRAQVSIGRIISMESESVVDHALVNALKAMNTDRTIMDLIEESHRFKVESKRRSH